jgi:hypothetical protein
VYAGTCSVGSAVARGVVLEFMSLCSTVPCHFALCNYLCCCSGDRVYVGTTDGHVLAFRLDTSGVGSRAVKGVLEARQSVGGAALHYTAP